MKNKDLILDMIIFLNELYINLSDTLHIQQHDTVEELKEAVNRETMTKIRHRKRLLNAMLSGYNLREEDEKNGNE